MARILLLPGDGIGPEVVAAARRVLEATAARFGLELTFDEALVGGASIDAHGIPLTDEVLAAAKAADAVLLGAVGGPKWEPLPYEVRPERALLALRKELGLYANLRPAAVFDALVEASTLKPEVVRGVDLVVVRELTGGIYFGEPRGVQGEPPEREGVNTLRYTEAEIRRIARVAFELARKRRGRVHSIDKANVLEATELWRTVVSELHAAEYAEIELHHMYVDNAAMQLIRDPRQFDVIVTTNLFGDILSDEAAMLTGSIGLLASASVGDGGRGLFEPVHGSAPDIAGRGIANPLATILSAAMLLEAALDAPEAAAAIRRAVARTLEGTTRTPDLGGTATTDEVTAAVLAALEDEEVPA